MQLQRQKVLQNLSLHLRPQQDASAEERRRRARESGAMLPRERRQHHRQQSVVHERRRHPKLLPALPPSDSRAPRESAGLIRTMPRALPKDFYNRDTEIVAREMLGAVLECRTEDGIASGIIVETEAYIGEEDPACHAAVGRTRRTEPLYGPPGIS